MQAPLQVFDLWNCLVVSVKQFLERCQHRVLLIVDACAPSAGTSIEGKGGIRVHEGSELRKGLRTRLHWSPVDD